MSSRSNWSTASRQSRGYGSQWDKLRLQILRRDNGLCQCQRCQGGKLRVTPASEVHHIKSKAECKRLGWTQAQMDQPGNLAAINSACHKRETTVAKGQKVAVRIGLDGFPVTRA